jgi:HEAT repeat protein
MARDVEVLVLGAGAAADAAEARLRRRGRDAIVFLEVGLYEAQPAQRRRIIRTFVAMAEPEAVPILRHLAERDPDSAVRQAAEDGLKKLAAP